MLKIQPDGCFAEPNDLAVSKEGHSANTVKQEKGEQDFKDLITKYNHLFQGISKIEDKKNGSEILGRFYMKPEVVPVAQRPNRYHIFSKNL